MGDDDEYAELTALQSSSTRGSVFSLAEFAELVSAALDINSVRFPDESLTLAFSPESSSPSCPFLSHNNYSFLPLLTSDTTSANPREPHPQQRGQLPRDMHPPLDSIDFGRGACVPGLGCAQGGSQSVPIITVTSPPSPSKSRRVLQKIRSGASAFIARTRIRTLSSPGTSPGRHTPLNPTSTATLTRRPVPNQVLLNPNNSNFEPIPIMSITASCKNNIHLRSAVSLLDLECFNNNSAYSLATNTADFYDDESDFVPYLPLACQYERAFPKSPSMPSLVSGSQKAAPTAKAVTIAAPPRPHSRTRMGTAGGRGSPCFSRPDSGGSNTSRARCTSAGHLQHRGSRPGGHRRSLSASSANSSTTDTASPVTPRSSAFIAGARSAHPHDQIRRFSTFSVESASDANVSGNEKARNTGVKEMLGLGLDESDDPFAKGSVQILRSKPRTKPIIQLYDPGIIIGPGNAKLGDAAIMTASHNGEGSDRSVTISSSNNHDLHSTVGRASPGERSSRGNRMARPSVSPIPISRMKKTPLVFPPMPWETEADWRRRHNQEKTEDEDEWTLCLGVSDTPGSRESAEAVSENGENKVAKQRKLKISEEVPIVVREVGRRCTTKSLPQLRVTQFKDNGIESTSKGGSISGADWTLMLPLYNIPPDPLLAKNKRISRSASHSPLAKTETHKIGDEERRRAISCTSMTPTVATLRDSFQSRPKSPVKAQPNVGGSTVRKLSTSPNRWSSPSTTVPFTEQNVDKNKLTPPTSSCSNRSNSFAVSSASQATYGSDGSEKSRASVVSVASLASETTSSTVTVSPGPWQREQMQRQEECLHPEEGGGDYLNAPNSRQRRQSASSVTSISTVRSTTEFVITETPCGGLRKTTVVNRLPLPVGREAEIRARTVSMSDFKRNSTPGSRMDASPSWTLRGLTSLFSALSTESEKETVRAPEREERDPEETRGGRTTMKDAKKNRESILHMPGQWLSVSDQEDSTESTDSHESLGHRRLTSNSRRGDGCEGTESKILDDGASNYSGTYHTPRSSFSLSAA